MAESKRTVIADRARAPDPGKRPKRVIEIEALTRYAHEQGLVQKRLKPEDLFAKPTMDMTKI